MNTLQDLRATLDQHAHEVPDDTGMARVAAVAGRARRVRQQRAGAVGVAAVLAVVGISLVPSLAERSAQPAAAPDTLSALGWTYDYRGAEHTDGDSLEVDLPASDTPRLVSWATAGAEQDVEVRFPGTRWVSDAGDYDDFVQVPSGPATTIRLTGPAGLTLATYDVDLGAAPDGIGSGAATYRSEVAGRRLLDAAIGEPGQASVSIDVPATRGTLWVGEMCEQVPDDLTMRVTVDDGKGFFSSGSCSGSTFDPGGSAGYGVPGRGRDLTMTMTLRRDGQPVADGDYPDLRVGLGAYVEAGRTIRPAGLAQPETIEDSGHTWAIDEVVTGTGADLPSTTVAARGMTVVGVSVRASGRTTWGVSLDGGAGSLLSSTPGPSGTAVLVRPGQRVGVTVHGDDAIVDEAALVLYRRVD